MTQGVQTESLLGGIVDKNHSDNKLIDHGSVFSFSENERTKNGRSKLNTFKQNAINTSYQSFKQAQLPPMKHKKDKTIRNSVDFVQNTPDYEGLSRASYTNGSSIKEVTKEAINTGVKIKLANGKELNIELSPE